MKHNTHILTPAQITEKVMTIGISKSQLSFLPQSLLGMLAGAYIGFGAMLYTLVKSDTSLSFASVQILSGLVFSLGLILVVIAGGELFTGNNLLTVAWAHKKIPTTAILQNWTIIFISNCIGAALLATLIYATGHGAMNHGKIAETYVKVANAKCELSFLTAFLRGIVCNILVCLAVWLAYSGHTVIDKIAGIIFPVTAFVAAGFEHSVANAYVLTMGLFAQADVTVHSTALSLQGCLHNLIPVLLGNIVGGGVFVGLVYWCIYLRKPQ